MNSAEAYAALRKLDVPVVSTADAAAALRQSSAAATKTLSRLARSGLVTAVRHGAWWVDGDVDPYRLPVFGGFELTKAGVRLATAEKALFDFAYLSAGGSRLFTALPELELPPRFRRGELKRWLAKISSARSRTITESKLDQLL